MIEIITYHDTNNYGALIQSLALKDFIQENFKVSVKFCKYHPKKLMYSEKYRPLITKYPNKFFGTLKKNWTINSWKKKAFFNYKLDRPENNCLLNIYGSDEIWNVDNAYHGYNPFYFGKSHNKNKISYATSIGRTNYSKLSTVLKKEISEFLEKFSSISVRDQNTAEFVYDLVKIDPKIVLDPTLIFTPKILKNEKFITKSLDYNYALVYGTVFSEDQKKLIFDFCKKKKLKIISVGYFNNWLKNNFLGLNPTTFYHFIKKSKFVFTSMFHGIMFSTKLNKQFYFSSDPIRINKIKTFVEEMDLRNREIKENLQDQEIDYLKLNKKINFNIQKSREFLIENIKLNII